MFELMTRIDEGADIFCENDLIDNLLVVNRALLNAIQFDCNI